MDIAEKLELLADAAKYDVACTSSGVDRSAQKGKLGNTSAAGICHSFTADGRCVTLLKVLMSNACIYNCAYCVNRISNEGKRTTFKPRELADLTISFYRRNYIEGLFLSSGVVKSPDFTTELMIEALSILREEYGFRGYIHAKAIPGTSPELLERLGSLADRMSVNLELPSQKSLNLLAPDKSKHDILSPMAFIKQGIEEARDTRRLMQKSKRASTTYLSTRNTAMAKPAREVRQFAPAGQSTQMIIGATPESDYQILNLSSALYQTFAMKRVFFSAYLPVNQDKRLPSNNAVALDREHRLYQADWLMRFYGFDVNEVIDESNPFLDLDVDPKANWALNHLDFFPVEVNKAPYASLLRVPGIGVRGAKLIIRARKTHVLREQELRKLGIAYKRAQFFITCQGKYQGGAVAFEREALRSRLAAPIQGGRHGSRSAKITPGQMSLFDQPQAGALWGGSPVGALGSGPAALKAGAA
ncbi:putative DNA modification/repair radical SAM protein [Anaerotardibacter muris]|uniref:putative DNA modification/repair radical SAM protein n=1 Tax=Anaerotardibacter muris TaxID=2941505 RepID=UPI00203EAC24|nr:putative DNA modification/repair radical SAM protein [Anaerotardibacter muris]